MRSSESKWAYMERLVTLILVSRVARCWYTHTRPCLDTGGTLNHFQPLPTVSLSVSHSLSLSLSVVVSPASPRCHLSCTRFFFTFFLPALSTHLSSFYSRTAPGSRTHAEFNPLCDDERTPLESFDIGDVGKYTGGRIYRIFFSMRSRRVRGNGPDGEFQPRRERGGVDQNYFQG